MKAKQKITARQAVAEFDRSGAALDEIRVMKIAEGLKLESAKGSVYAREHGRLLRKYGKDHPRTAEMASRIISNRKYKVAIALEYRNAATERPDPGAGWGVDGFVRTADGEALNGVTVAAYDRQDKWHQELGYTCTNQHGYFSLITETLPEKPPQPVFIRASKGNKILPSSIPQLVPTPGSTERVEIVTGEQGGERGDCASPEGKTPSSHTPPEPVAPVKVSTSLKAGSNTPASGNQGARRAKKAAPVKKDRK